MTACAYCYAESEEHKACGRCKSRYFCSKECQKKDWKQGHKHWCGKSGEKNIDWEIRDVEGKGKGMFALKTFEKNDKIMVERPVISISNASDFSRVKLEAGSEHDAVVELAHCKDGSLADIFGTNCAALDDDSEETGLFVDFSRINHSCIGNTTHNFMRDRGGVMVLVADEKITAGEEFTFSYASKLNARQRSVLLAAKWRFACDCLACTDSVVGDKLDRINELDDEICHQVRQGKSDTAIRTGHKLLALYDELKMSDVLYQRTYYDMFQGAISRKRTYGQAVVLIEKARDHSLAFYGYESTVVRKHQWLVAYPRFHRNFGLQDLLG
jgi:hypothetical protein